ncbi:MAG: DUF4965 domain-containing protein [Candidatus Aminicenantales bacterium]
MRKKWLWSLLALSIVWPVGGGPGAAAAGAPGTRPPAVPLVTHDPYFSIWAVKDKLTDDWPRHWTGTVHGLSALARVDGRAFRVMGPSPWQVPALSQAGLEITPTQTVYTFADAGVELSLTFTSPLLIEDLDVMSRPVTYITAAFRSTDGRSHSVSFYFGAPAALCVNTPDEKVVWGRHLVPGLEVMAIGSKDQPVLEKKGDDLRIDWGRFYLAAPKADASASAMASADVCRNTFAKNGRLPDADDMEMPRPADDDLAATVVFDYGTVGGTVSSRHLLLAYDDGFSIEYFYRKLRPYWRRTGWEARDLLAAAERDYLSLLERCRDFDGELMADMKRAGGEKYAFTASLAYRQSISACKLVADIDGTPLFFPRENFSNGCISTVDVIYPAAPQYILLSPALVRGMLIPVMDYAKSPQWPFPFAPHDLGTYPQANGQVYGGGNKTEDDQMPVEESGNMIILVAALAQAEGKPDFAVRYWDLVARWAGYLKDKGFDPENQLCTDDFAGHLAHNANLSLKAILALRSYAWLCEKTGRRAEAGEYLGISKKFARDWVAKADDGDHFRLAFDRPGTWSQKYNLVWDKILGFNLFPASVARKELDHYLKSQLKYGLPLDNRKTYTKLDWIFWTATLADDAATFGRLTDPVFAFLGETPDRVPMTDWYWTDSGKQAGFQARPVVGGVLIKMLADPAIRAKWQGKAGAK